MWFVYTEKVYTVYIYIYTHTQIYKHTHTHTHTYTYIHIYIYIYIYIYIHTYIHTHTHYYTICSIIETTGILGYAMATYEQQLFSIKITNSTMFQFIIIELKYI